MALSGSAVPCVSVSLFLMIIDLYFARIEAIFIRRRVFRKPASQVLHLVVTISASRSRNPSLLNTSMFLIPASFFFRIASCRVYGVSTSMHCWDDSEAFCVS
ncbi:hypothetical protein F4859DRAFT_497961 [Xylaria cf. heliscus]|nr:hypothetical protein F4859DRAFT_497961 [Xylaria cf. heliscus]